MNKQIQKLSNSYAQIFINNANLRHKVSAEKIKEFGYYIDIRREYGFQRITEPLKRKIESSFKNLNFKNIEFDNFGGVSLRVNLNNAITIIDKGMRQ